MIIFKDHVPSDCVKAFEAVFKEVSPGSRKPQMTLVVTKQPHLPHDLAQFAEGLEMILIGDFYGHEPVVDFALGPVRPLNARNCVRHESTSKGLRLCQRDALWVLLELRC